MKFLTKIVSSTENSIQLLCDSLLEEEVVALPSETVYGLAGLSFSEKALLKIFQAKERPLLDPLISHIPSSWIQDSNLALQELEKQNLIELSTFSEIQKKIALLLIKEFWPGPLTLVFPKNKKLPDLATSGLNTAAIRCPAHPLFQKILEKIQQPLCAPSANRFGRISPTNTKAVFTELEGRIPYILEGGTCNVGIESTVVFIHQDSLTLLRPGSISKEEIENLFIKNNIKNIPVSHLKDSHFPNNSLPSPGLLKSHYAPEKKLYLLNEEPLPTPLPPYGLILLSEKENLHSFLNKNALKIKPENIYHLSQDFDAKKITQNLFQILRLADEDNKNKILICETPENVNSGLLWAVVDRLKKAAFK